MVNVPAGKVVAPRMWPFRIVTLLRVPVRSTPVPEAGLAVEEMVNPLRSSVTSSAEMLMPLPVVTPRLPVR